MTEVQAPSVEAREQELACQVEQTDSLMKKPTKFPVPVKAMSDLMMNW